MFYGWVITFTGFILCVIGIGARYSFGIFFESLEAEFGMSRAMTSGIFSVYMILCAGVAIFGGWALDRYGPRKTIGIMSIFTGVSFVLTSFVSSPWHLLFTYGILLAIGTGAIYGSVNSTVSRWFVRKRGVAVGFSSSGGGVGLIVLSPITSYLILRFEWRTAYLLLGFAAGGLMLIASLFQRKDPAEMGLKPDGEPNPAIASTTDVSRKNSTLDSLSIRYIARTKQFWEIAAIWFFISIGLHMVVVHAVTYATDHHISPIKAAMVMSVIGVTNISSRLPIGKLIDRFGVQKVGMACAALQALDILWLTQADTMTRMIIFGIFFGTMWGGIGTTITVLVSEIFGTRRLGFIMGFTSAAWAIGASIGPTLGGYLFDINHSYLVAFMLAALGHVVASLFFYKTRPIGS